MKTSPTITELVQLHPAATRVLSRYGIDFCCGGENTIDDACAASGLDRDELLEEIEREQTNGEEEVRWNERASNELIAHILETYHEPLRKELPTLIRLSEKVEQVHTDRSDCPHGLKAHLEQMKESIELHLLKEGRILFPLILSGRASQARMPVKILMQEHKDVGNDLREIRRLTNAFQLPEYACPTWRELYQGLKRFERDMHRHVHLENNILFPNVLKRDGGV